MSDSIRLPPKVTVFERGWLSANNVLFEGSQTATLVDSGYCAHSDLTARLVKQGLAGRPLDVLLNTHLHSDHCGGNAMLQELYPKLQTLIPPGMQAQVRQWDPVALTYVPTGQQCPLFKMTGVLLPGSEIVLSDRRWQIHAAPGHDPHSVILFEPQSRTLISADALWQNGFGVVFPELEGGAAFDEVADTLDLIERLAPAVVIPGHGKVFSQVHESLVAARRRLDSFVQSPHRHATHAAKVLLKFRLLEIQKVQLAEGIRWASATPYFSLVHKRWFPDVDQAAWVKQLFDDLAHAGAVRYEGNLVLNA